MSELFLQCVLTYMISFTLTLIQILIHPSLHFLEPWDIPCLDLWRMPTMIWRRCLNGLRVGFGHVGGSLVLGGRAFMTAVMMTMVMPEEVKRDRKSVV